MFKFPKLKTPHLFPARHAGKMVLLFALMMLFVSPFDILPSREFGYAYLLVVPVCAFVSVFLGTLTTAMTRAYFGLIQTGRVIQWTGFWLATSLSTGLASYLFTTDATLALSLYNGFVVFTGAFAAAYLLGEIPWRGRTWLPMKRKH